MLRLVSFLTGTTLAIAVATGAEPWEGAWVYEPAHTSRCENSNSLEKAFAGVRGVIISASSEISTYWQLTEKGEQTLRGDKGAILGFENHEDFWECRIGKVTDLTDLPAWIFDVECGGEGYIWQSRTVVMQTAEPKGMAAYNLGWAGETADAGSLTQLYRCPPPKPRAKP